MKLRLSLTGLLAMLVAISTQATTLKLSPDIDLLVLDGHKISGSLLKGAEGLELERGQHQFLFRVEKNLQKGPQQNEMWLSAPMIVTFNTVHARSVTIKLPLLTSHPLRKAFDKNADFQLVDEKGVLIECQRDRLNTAGSMDFEQAMVIYNLKGNVASVARFARQPKPGSAASESPDDLASSQHPGGRLLYLWYQQVDSATRQRFMVLMQALRTS